VRLRATVEENPLAGFKTAARPSPQRPRSNPEKLIGMGARCRRGGDRGALTQPEWDRGSMQT